MREPDPNEHKSHAPEGSGAICEFGGAIAGVRSTKQSALIINSEAIAGVRSTKQSALIITYGAVDALKL